MKSVTYQYILDNPNYLRQFKGNNTISIICNYCDNSKNITKSKIQKKLYRGSKNFYCNSKCSSLYRRKISRVVKNCTTCNKEISKTPSELKKIKNVFCSQSCAAKYNGHKYPKRKLNNKCLKCKKACSINKKYCSKLCNPFYIDWGQITLKEIKNKRKYQKYVRIRELARSIYKKSNKLKYCVFCNYKNHYDVCHIKPIYTYPDETPISIINNIDNLIALCKNHHWELDNGYLDINIIIGGAA